MRGRAAAAELVEQLNSLFGLRHCGRTLPRREHPSAYGQMGRCLSPCLNDLDPNLYRERLEAALRLFVGRNGGQALLAHVDAQIAEARDAQRYERAAWLQRRRARIEASAGRLGGVLRAIHTGARLVLAPHTRSGGRFDAIWIAGGKVVDWGAVDGSPLRPQSARVRTRPPWALGGWLPADAIAEARLVGAWVAANAGRRWSRAAGGRGGGRRVLGADRLRRAPRTRPRARAHGQAGEQARGSVPGPRVPNRHLNGSGTRPRRPHCGSAARVRPLIRRGRDERR